MSSAKVMSPGASSSTMSSHKNYHQRVVMSGSAFSPRSRVMRTDLESSKVKVIVRVRPFLASETLQGSPTSCISITKGNGTPFEHEDTLHILDPKTRRNESYKLDCCYGQDDDIGKIFSKEVHPILPGLFRGSNATVFAYGATGSGKTYTMQGTTDRPGIMLLAMSKILSLAENSKSTVEISYYEVYLDRCYDLLETKNKEVPIMEDAEGRVQLRGLTQVKVRSMDDFQKNFEYGCMRRKVGHTGLNDVSSRSHGVLMVSVTSVDVNPDLPLVGKLNLIDLAGNEDNRRTGNEGIRLNESVSINQSLFALSNVIHALNANENRVPYRDSKLTRILQDSLGGTSRALMIACLNPISYTEAQHTVSLAARSRQIVNHINPESKQETPKAKIDMNARLNAWLETKGKSSVKSVKPISPASGKLLSPASAKRTPSKFHTRSNPRLGKLLGPPLRVKVSSKIEEKSNSNSSDTNQTADLQKTDNQKIDIPAESVKASQDVPTAYEVLDMNQTPSFLQFDDDPEKENKSVNKMSSEGSSPTLTERLKRLESAFTEMLTPKNPKMVPNAINKESAYSEMFTPKNVLAVSDMLTPQNPNIISSTTITTTEKEFTEIENLQNPSISSNAITTDSAFTDAPYGSAITSETAITVTEEMPLVNFTPSSMSYQLCSEPLSPKTPRVQQRVSEENPQYRNCDLAEVSLRGTPLERFSARSTGLKKCLVQEYISFLNTASREELLALKGIGEKRANYILELREESPEPFKELEDLERIGLTKRQVQAMFRTTARYIFS